MLRSITRDVHLSDIAKSSLCRSFSCRHQSRFTPSVRYSLSFARHYSPLAPGQTQKPTEDPSSIPIVPISRKPKVELRPGPVKPKTLSPATPNKQVTKQAGSQTTPTLSLSAAKQEALKDITDAEQHGYLTPPPPGANWFRATLHKAIQLAKFYFRGVKLIFTRRGEIAQIRARIRAGGLPLSRSEFRLIHTQKDDINKVIPFLVIALLLEEVIPLIAIYAPFMLPSTCVLPSQRQRIEAKRAEKALASSINSKAILANVKAQASSGQVSLTLIKRVEGAPTAVCSLLGLSTLGFDALRIRRIRKHLQFIADDDVLLIQQSPRLSESEQTNALAERGLLAKSACNEKILESWLTAVKDKTSEEALATRLYLIISGQ